MPRSAWLAVVAAAWLITGAGLAQEIPEAPLRPDPNAEAEDEEGRLPEAEQPSPEQQRAPPLIAAIDRIESAIRSLTAEEDERYRQAEEQRKIDDLQAQQDMARWAFWMLVATAFAIFLTVVGIALIWRTLHHTRRAADYASSMLNEARKTTSAAMAAVGTERAWIVHDDYRVIEAINCEARGTTISHSIGIQISVQNAGRSPAIHFRPHLDHKIIGFNEALPDFSIPPIDDHEYCGSIIGPGICFFSEPLFLKDDEMEKLWAGHPSQSRVVIYCKCTYNDVFNPSVQRITEFTSVFLLRNFHLPDWSIGDLNCTLHPSGTQSAT